MSPQLKDAVNTNLLKRLRFMRLVTDNLFDPEGTNRLQFHKASVVVAETIGVANGNMPASVAYSGWVYTEELFDGIGMDITADPTPDEVKALLNLVELLSEIPLEGREKEYFEERKGLEDLSIEKPVLGLIRLLTLSKLMMLRKEQFIEAGTSLVELTTSLHLIQGDLGNWKQIGVKPFWFTDEFLIFRDSDEERNSLPEEERNALAAKEEELVIKLFMVRHASSDGRPLKQFYRKRQEEAKQAEETNNGENAD